MACAVHGLPIHLARDVLAELLPSSHPRSYATGRVKVLCKGVQIRRALVDELGLSKKLALSLGRSYGYREHSERISSDRHPGRRTPVAQDPGHRMHPIRAFIRKPFEDCGPGAHSAHTACSKPYSSSSFSPLL